MRREIGMTLKSWSPGTFEDLERSCITLSTISPFSKIILELKPTSLRLQTRLRKEPWIALLFSNGEKNACITQFKVGMI